MVGATFPQMHPDDILWNFSLARGLQTQTLWYLLHMPRAGGSHGGISCRLISPPGRKADTEF